MENGNLVTGIVAFDYQAKLFTHDNMSSVASEDLVVDKAGRPLARRRIFANQEAIVDVIILGGHGQIFLGISMLVKRLHDSQP